MNFKNAGKNSDLNGFLDKGSRLSGELQFETTFRVHGSFTGTVSSEGDLIVGEGGELDGQLQVGDLFVSGIVRGRITARKKVHIAATGRVYAEIETPTLIIDEGAFFEGNCSMPRGAEGKKPPQAAKPEV